MTDSVTLNKSEVPPGGRKIFRVGRVEVAVFNVGGDYFALQNRCAHQMGPVCEGGIGGALFSRPEGGRLKFEWAREGQILTCPWHGLEYDIKTGKSLALRELRLRSCQVTVGENELTVGL